MDEVIYYSAGELAKLLNISRQNLAYKIKKGKIKPVSYIKSRYKLFTELEVQKAKLWHDSKRRGRNANNKFIAPVNSSSTAERSSKGGDS